MRLIAHAGWTRRRFEDTYGFSRNRLTHQGQGRFNRIAQSLIDALEDLYASQGSSLGQASRELFGTDNIQQVYTDWRLEKRREASLPLKFVRQLVGERPIERLVRQVGGISTLSLELRVNEYTLRRYVDGVTRELPEDIKEALRHTGWRWTESFIKACAKDDAQRTM